jgi:autotransporter strand-loop-strand O-heptosyltransferase
MSARQPVVVACADWGAPVVMITCPTHPTNEFATQYRVINWHAYNSYWHNARSGFDHMDYLWCPHRPAHREYLRPPDITRSLPASGDIR